MNDKPTQTVIDYLKETIEHSDQWTMFSAEPDYDGFGIIWDHEAYLVVVMKAKVVEE